MVIAVEKFRRIVDGGGAVCFGRALLSSASSVVQHRRLFIESGGDCIPGNNSINFNLGAEPTAAPNSISGLGGYLGSASLSQLTSPMLSPLPVSSDGQVFNPAPTQVLGMGASFSLAVQVNVHNQEVTAALQNPGTADFSRDPYGFQYVNLSQSQEPGSGAYLATGLMAGGGILTAGSPALAAMYSATVQKGLDELKTLCTTQMVMKGKPLCNCIPQPRASVQRLLERAEVILPRALPHRGVNVATRKKLPSRRKER